MHVCLCGYACMYVGVCIEACLRERKGVHVRMLGFVRPWWAQACRACAHHGRGDRGVTEGKECC